MARRRTQRRARGREVANFFAEFAPLVRATISRVRWRCLVADRRGATVLLIRSRHDLLWLPSPRSSASGFGPAVVEVCSGCEGRKRVPDRFGRLVECGRCGGRGRLARDPMDVLGLPVATSSTVAPVPVRTVPCDGCAGSGVRRSERCVYCDGEGRRPLHAFELRVDVRDVDERDPLSAAVDRRREAGSYAELDRALDGLRRVDRSVHRDLLEAIDLREQLGPRLEEALAFVVVRMPDPVRVPADVRANERLLRERRTRARGSGPGRSDRAALAVRNAEIRRLDRDRRPVQWIAREYGLSVSTVYEILGGEGSAA